MYICIWKSCFWLKEMTSQVQFTVSELSAIAHNMMLSHLLATD